MFGVRFQSPAASRAGRGAANLRWRVSAGTVVPTRFSQEPFPKGWFPRRANNTRVKDAGMVIRERNVPMNRRLARFGVLLALVALAPDTARDPEVGESYQVPYRLTDTNHFLVRVRINGKGPFNFLVDTGAPALFVATETARKIGLEPAKGKFWTPVERLDFEGGARLTHIK